MNERVSDEDLMAIALAASHGDYGYPTMVSVPWKNGMNGKALFDGNDWHISEADAIARAEEMRVSKIASLKKQIAKMEKLRFVTSKEEK